MGGRLTALVLCLCSLGSCDRLLPFGQGRGDGGREAATPDLPPVGDERTRGDAPADARPGERGRADAAPNGGSVQWAKVWSGVSAATGRAVALSSSRIYVAAQYESSIQIGVLDTKHTGGADGVAVRVTLDGEPDAVAPLATSAEDSAQSVAVIPGPSAITDQVWVGGQLGAPYALNGKSLSGLFLMKMNATTWTPAYAADLQGGGCGACGVHAILPSTAAVIGVMATYVGNLSMPPSPPPVPAATGVAVSFWYPSGAIWSVRGSLHGIAALGRGFAGDPTQVYFASDQASAAWVNANGPRFWGWSYPAASAAAVLLDGQSLYLVGTFKDQLNVPPLPSQPMPGQHPFVAELDRDTGNALWAKPIGGGGAAEAIAATVSGGLLYIGGRHGPGADLGQGTLVNTAGGQDAFVLCFNPATKVTRWALVFGGSGDDMVRGVAAGAARVVVTGAVSGSGHLPDPAKSSFAAPAGGIVLLSVQP